MCVLWWHGNFLINVGYSRWGWFDKSNAEVSKDHFYCKILNKFLHYKFAAFARHIWQEAWAKANMWVDERSTFEGFDIVMAPVPFLWRWTRAIKSIDCIFSSSVLVKGGYSLENGVDDPDHSRQNGKWLINMYSLSGWSKLFPHADEDMCQALSSSSSLSWIQNWFLHFILIYVTTTFWEMTAFGFIWIDWLLLHTL